MDSIFLRSNEDVGDHPIRSMISCFNIVFRLQFCNFTVNNDSFFNRESRLWAFSVIQLGVKLDCCPSDRRQNFLIRGNHLPVANGLGYATSSKISASVVQIFLKDTYQGGENTYRFFNVFQRLCYYVLSVWFLEKVAFY